MEGLRPYHHTLRTTDIDSHIDHFEQKYNFQITCNMPSQLMELWWLEEYLVFLLADLDSSLTTNNYGDCAKKIDFFVPETVV